MDKSKIPKGFYCYDDNGMCPYHKEIPFIKIPYTSYFYGSAVECTYLKINTAKLWLDTEHNYKWSAWLLFDQCKLCE